MSASICRGLGRLVIAKWRWDERSAYARGITRMIWLFMGLQFLDVLTTWLGLRVGHSEASPAVRFFLGRNALAGLILSKSVAFGLLVALLSRRPRSLRIVNIWQTAPVA